MQESEDACEEVGSLLGDALFCLPWVIAVGTHGECCSQKFSFIIQTQTSSYSVGLTETLPP